MSLEPVENNNEVEPLAGEGMDPTVWGISEEFIAEPDLRALHNDILTRLRRENPEADVLETLLMERVASYYVYMRSREAQGFISGNEFKNLTQLWVSMQADLRKTKTSSADITAAKDEMMQMFMHAFNNSLKGVDLDSALIIKTRMMEELSE